MLTQEQINCIPDELKEWNQWVGFKLISKDGWKTDKIPKNPRNGRNAQVNNSATWGTFEKALKRGPDGIGFVFTREDPYVGGDLDNCVNPETGEIDLLRLLFFKCTP